MHDDGRGLDGERALLLARLREAIDATQDEGEALREIARIVVPDFADYCFVDSVEPDGTMRRLAEAHADPGKAPLLVALARHLPPPETNPRVRVLRSGKPVLNETLTDADYRAIAVDAEHRELLRGLAPRSGIIAPLVVRGRAVGTLTLVHSDSGRRYEERDVAVARSIAHRAALALDNTRLHRDVEEWSAHVDRMLRRASFLAEFSRALAAAALDSATVLRTAAQRAIPFVADGCTVHVATDLGPRLLLACGPDREPVTTGPFAGLQAIGTRFIASLLKEGQPRVLPDVDDEALALLSDDAEGLARLRALGVRSAIGVPLLGRDSPLGALTFCSTAPRRFGPADLPFVADLGSRVAIVADNARLYSEAREANRAKDEFLAILSHEMRTPLAAMRPWSYLLRVGKLQGEEVVRALDAIDRSVEQQLRLIDDLLDVSRVITGKLRLDPEALVLDEVVDRALEDVQVAAHGKQVRIVVERSASPIELRGDFQRLVQVVTNLLTNAIKFSRAGERVVVRLVRGGPRAIIEVRDEGEGIAPSFLPHVFDRFRQGDATRTRRHEGLGLGLAIARNIVELHGGSITAASLGRGRGATFTVELPWPPGRDETAIAWRRTPAPSSLWGATLLDRVRVLLVEDDGETRIALARSLVHFGAAVESVASAREALAAFDRGPPDVLVSDIAMPDEDGYWLIEQVRAREGTLGRRVPALALTASAREEDRARALSAGYAVHLSKPVAPQELAATIATLAHAGAPRP